MYVDLKREWKPIVDEPEVVRQLREARNAIAARPKEADRPCLVTAISSATCRSHGDFLRGGAGVALSFLAAAIGDPMGSITSWHDSHTREECVTVMDLAIKLASEADHA